MKLFESLRSREALSQEMVEKIIADPRAYDEQGELLFADITIQAVWQDPEIDCIWWEAREAINEIIADLIPEAKNRPAKRASLWPELDSDSDL